MPLPGRAAELGPVLGTDTSADQDEQRRAREVSPHLVILRLVAVPIYPSLMRWMTLPAVMLFTSAGRAGQGARPAIIDLWMSGKPAFGIYAPNENPGPRGQSPRPACTRAKAARSWR